MNCKAFSDSETLCRQHDGSVDRYILGCKKYSRNRQTIEIMAPENDSNSPQSSPKIPSYNPSDRIPGNGPITASGLFKSVDGKTIEIRDVWASNLEEEMGNIREILEKYPYVAMVRNSTFFFLLTFASV